MTSSTNTQMAIAARTPTKMATISMELAIISGTIGKVEDFSNWIHFSAGAWRAPNRCQLGRSQRPFISGLCDQVGAEAIPKLNPFIATLIRCDPEKDEAYSEEARVHFGEVFGKCATSTRKLTTSISARPRLEPARSRSGSG